VFHLELAPGKAAFCCADELYACYHLTYVAWHRCRHRRIARPPGG
jgi:hypothetical protein